MATASLPSAKSYLIDAIKARLDADCKDTAGNAIVKTFGLYQGQFDHEGKESAIAYPAVFLQFASLEYKAQMTNLQTTDTVITLYIAAHNLDAASKAYLDTVEYIQFSIQGYEDPTGVFSVLKRRAERQTLSRTNVIVWEVDYTTFLRDIGSSRYRRLVKIAPPITLNLTMDEDQLANADPGGPDNDDDGN